MLIDLKIKNFAIISDAHVEFQQGLNILSGETGAGKSILLKGLSLLMGQKADSSFVKEDCNEALVEGIFDLSQRKDILSKLAELSISSDDDLLIVRRTIPKNGKSRVFLNDSSSTLSTLRSLISPLVEVTGRSTPLIEMTGQHENRHLLSTNYQLEMLDHYIGIDRELKTYRLSYDRLKEIESELEQIRSQMQNREQRLDFLKFQDSEISDLDLSAGDELKIEAAAKRAKNKAKIESFVDQAYSDLDQSERSISSRLQNLLKRGQELSNFEPGLQAGTELIDQAFNFVQEAVHEFRNFDFSDSGLNETDAEEKLSKLRKLQRKFGDSAEDIIAFHQQILSEIQQLEKAESDISALENEQDDLIDNLTKIADSLHKKRSKGGKVFVESINGELKDLEMKGVVFSLGLEKNKDLNRRGITSVEFMVQNSGKQPARPLAKTASGGEMSRILLAIKSVAGVTHFPRTYLFDEVDSGVSGKTAEKVGKKLHSISKGQQVICITHLPQVAAQSDCHFLIEKNQERGQFQTQIKKLNDKDHLSEIARLISGEKITKASLSHAQELISQSRA